VKSKRLQEIIALQQRISAEINDSLVGKHEVLLIEGTSRKSDEFLAGRTDSNKVIIIPREEEISEGDYVEVRIKKGTSATLFGDYIKMIDKRIAPVRSEAV
jgi:tRNA-2-methylthio-N6-dimethylallyladenosine synthase